MCAGYIYDYLAGPSDTSHFGTLILTSTTTDMEKKAMKKAAPRTSTRSLTSTTTDMEKKAMKKAASTRSLASTTTDREKKAMKKATSTRSLTSDAPKAAPRSLASTTTDMEKKAMKKSNSRTLSRQIVVTSEAPKATEKAKRSYEREDLTGNFMKNFTASPKTEQASAFSAKCADLLDRVWAELPQGGIFDEIFEIAARVTQDPDFDPFKSLCALIDTYDLSARQIRVVLQLCSPIVTVCCDLTDRLARYLGMSCANRLMGSACNELQCEKCGDFLSGLPFVRVCYNATRLGFVKGDTDSIDIDALVDCIVNWLDPKEDEEPKAPKSAPKAPKAPKSAALKRAHEKAAQIAALQDGIEALQAQLTKILSAK